MTDTNTLLMMVLKQHFNDHPEKLDQALKVVKDYSNKRSNAEEYHKTLNTLLETMKDLPNNILYYFLTMVPLPKSTQNNEVIISEIMMNYKIPSNDEVQLMLTNYLKKLDEPSSSSSSCDHQIIERQSVNIEMSPNEVIEIDNQEQDNLKDPDFTVPNKKAKLTKPKNKNNKLTEDTLKCKTLLDLCAEYVISNQNQLEKFYKNQKQKVWNLLNGNVCNGDDLMKCYDLLKDLNKKSKWIRSIDDEDALGEIIQEEYKDSDIFLKEQHLTNRDEDDPFILSDKIQAAIDNLFDF